MKLRILILFSLFSSLSFSQSSKEFDKKWELAKGHFEDENFDLALMLFKNLSTENIENQYEEYANYYTALCLFKQNNLRESRQYLLQLYNKYPLWSNNNETKYLLANIEFINGEYSKALRILDSVEVKDVEKLKIHYLSKIESLHLIEKLHNEFPNDKEVGITYCFKIASKTPLFEQDKEIIYSLIDKCNIKNSKLKNHLEASTDEHFKDTFNIAAIYPFEKTELEIFSTKRKNQFVIDHYWGLKQAIDTLSKTGVHLKLHLYDSKNDTNQVIEILKKPELKQMDLIVGPVYSKNLKYVSRFADQNQIVCFNPLLRTAEELNDSGFVYLYNSTPHSIGIKSAEFILDSFAGKKIMIVAFDDPKDTLITHAFIERLKKDSVYVNKKLIIKRGTDVLTQLSKVKNGDAEIIFAPSTNTSIGTNITSWLIMRGINIPTIGNSKWLESREYNIIKANEFTSYFFDENYQFNALDSSKTFDRKYFSKYNIPPTEASYKGFELGMFIGYNLSKYGKYFNQALWSMIPQKGVFYPYFDYNESYFNNFVPILKLKDYQLVPANFNTKVNKEESTDEQSKE